MYTSRTLARDARLIDKRVFFPACYAMPCVMTKGAKRETIEAYSFGVSFHRQRFHLIYRRVLYKNFNLLDKFTVSICKFLFYSVNFMCRNKIIRLDNVNFCYLYYLKLNRKNGLYKSISVQFFYVILYSVNSN